MVPPEPTARDSFIPPTMINRPTLVVILADRQLAGAQRRIFPDSADSVFRARLPAVHAAAVAAGWDVIGRHPEDVSVERPNNVIPFTPALHATEMGYLLIAPMHPPQLVLGARTGREIRSLLTAYCATIPSC